MKKTFAAGAALALSLAVGSASAATLVNVELVSVGDSVVYNGVWAGEYIIKVDGVPIGAVCDDFNTHITVGQTWQAWAYTPAEVAAGAGKFASQGRYEEAGWIFDQMDSMTPYQRARAQAAVWNLMGANPTLDALATSYRDQAIDGTHNTWSSNMWFLTSIPTGAAQEFMLDGSALSQVPVPAAIWLFGSGIIGLVAVARRRRQ